MERELWTRAGMVVSIIALTTLIFATPSLMGHPPPELASYPLLIVGMPTNESYVIVYLSAAVQAYRYDVARIDVNGTGTASNRTVSANETYGLSMWVPVQVPSSGNLTVHTYLVDQPGNYFEYNVSVRTDLDAGRTVMIFTFPDEKGNPTLEVRKFPPAEDLRWPVPQRGTLP